MIGFFRKLEAQGADLPTPLGFLSTHPLTRERIVALEALARGAGPGTPLLPGIAWRRVRSGCDQVWPAA